MPVDTRPTFEDLAMKYGLRCKHGKSFNLCVRCVGIEDVVFANDAQRDAVTSAMGSVRQSEFARLAANAAGSQRAPVDTRPTFEDLAMRYGLRCKHGKSFNLCVRCIGIEDVVFANDAQRNAVTSAMGSVRQSEFALLAANAAASQRTPVYTKPSLNDLALKYGLKCKHVKSFNLCLRCISIGDVVFANDAQRAAVMREWES